jgi:hypothetical protein
MACFCDKEKEDKKDPENKNFTITRNDDGTEVTEDVKVCKQYFEDKAYSAKLGGGISLVIVVINLILKTVIIELITWIGEDTISEQLSSITNGVFYA